MVKNCGYMIKSKNEPKLYIAGDTIYCNHVEETLDEKPDITIVNAGGATLPLGRAITMDEQDIKKVCEYNKETKIIAVHMDVVNHCILTREQLKRYLTENKILQRVKILDDGENYSC